MKLFKLTFRTVDLCVKKKKVIILCEMVENFFVLGEFYSCFVTSGRLSNILERNSVVAIGLTAPEKCDLVTESQPICYDMLFGVSSNSQEHSIACVCLSFLGARKIANSDY
jgi:hypothetical protein